MPAYKNRNTAREVVENAENAVNAVNAVNAENAITAQIVESGGVLSSIVELTSGTSWTAPEGVRFVRGRVTGGGGASSSAYSGGGGGGSEFFAPIKAGVTYTYSVAAPNGTSSITISGVTYSGGPGGAASGNFGGLGGTGSNGVSFTGDSGAGGVGGPNPGGVGAFGAGRGASSGASDAQPGRIILELYK